MDLRIDEMRKYTAKEKKQLESNPYTYKVTDHKLMFTAEFNRTGCFPLQVVHNIPTLFQTVLDIEYTFE